MRVMLTFVAFGIVLNLLRILLVNHFRLGGEQKKKTIDLHGSFLAQLVSPSCHLRLVFFVSGKSSITFSHGVQDGVQLQKVGPDHPQATAAISPVASSTRKPRQLAE